MELGKGAWQGYECAIVGGGPSLKNFDFSKIPSRLKIIAVNAAFKFCPQADLCFSEDVRFIEKFGAQLFQNFKGTTLWHCLRGIDPERGLKACTTVRIIRELRDDKYWSDNLGSLSFSSNSVVGAINLAEILGVTKIYLLGVDCRAEGPVLENFHGEYPQDWQVTALNAYSWKSDFEYWVAPNVRVPVVNVVNPAYESAVECWPKITQQEFIGQ